MAKKEEKKKDEKKKYDKHKELVEIKGPLKFRRVHREHQPKVD
jgi:hypothetical protein